ncbi:GTA-gp10 family protein [Candidatus Phycosocius spiralis]|uniref:Gene transfer agent family protein n=1 Tax=Candidatus Phycosocius spiralis TaxID=2815099 RepID=A0ABQ4PXA3_9PROT|nr:GTA-gp10 family protein [Candidatus Phycosocius spiralis]GIU67615.1 hypothetical protein PsB1_1769 [Candidatus Phycosocius spiralis]
MSSLPNCARGEAVMQADGRPLKLCLTLGALARLEAAFSVETLPDLEARLRNLSGQDILVVISALLSGESLSPSDLAQCRIDPEEAVRAIAQAFERAGA